MPSQASTSAEFAVKLSDGDLRAVRVDHAEGLLEGDFWFCLVLAWTRERSHRRADVFDWRGGALLISSGTSISKVHHPANTIWTMELDVGLPSMQ